MSAVVGEAITLEGETGSRSSLVKPFIMPAFLLAFAAYLFVGMVTMRVPEGTAFPGPRFFPGLIAGGLTLFAVLLIVGAVRDRVRERETIVLLDESGEEVAPVVRKVRVDWKSMTWVIASFIAFIIALPYLGWILAAGLLFWGVSRGFGSMKHVTGLVVGLTLSSLIYIAFDMVLGMSLPSGVLGWGF